MRLPYEAMHGLGHRYMPAELLMEGKMSKAADVYSFAMLMCELATGQQLFEGMRQSQVCESPTNNNNIYPPKKMIFSTPALNVA